MKVTIDIPDEHVEMVRRSGYVIRQHGDWANHALINCGLLVQDALPQPVPDYKPGDRVLVVKNGTHYGDVHVVVAIEDAQAWVKPEKAVSLSCSGFIVDDLARLSPAPDQTP